MRGRLALLTFLLLAAPAAARAHRLEAECRVLPGKMVRVESWYDGTGDAPAGARVKVYRAAGNQLLAEGQLDDRGAFTFPFDRAEPLSVVVSHQGHRKTVKVPASDLDPTLPKEEGRPVDPQAAAPPRADREPRTTAKDVVLGVTFLLAAAAFWLSVRNARRLRGLPPSSG
jgi:hypothetical protein